MKCCSHMVIVEKHQQTLKESIMTVNIQIQSIIVRAKDFQKTFGIPDSTRADWENPNSKRYKPTFPKTVKPADRYVGSYYSDVIAWLDSRRSE